jgi:hypothetical protein
MLSGGNFLQELRERDPHTALLIERIIDGINIMGNHINVDPTGKVSPPPPHDALMVTAGDNMVHVSISNQQALNKNAHNIVEYSNDSGLSWRHANLVSANEGFIALPAFKGDGVTPHNWIFRSYPQYLGSDAQNQHTYFGSKNSPTVVNVNGTSKMDIPAAVGAGTANPNGQEAGLGLGTVLNRPAPGPKRPNLNNS